MVYNLVTEADDGLTVDLEDSVIVVPAGSSESVKVTARAARNGEYSFKVTALGADNSVVDEQEFTAKVEGKATVGGNATIALTIILAIVFVVLLVVLIVLLTRKPAKSDELGESYY
jgi:preprotein translocase subunit SecG